MLALKLLKFSGLSILKSGSKHWMQSTLLTLVSVGLSGWSCQIKQELGDVAGVELILRHNEALHDVLSEFAEGQELEKGLDWFLIGFPRPPEAVRFALQLQRTIRRLFAESPSQILNSIAIHVGQVMIDPGNGPLQGNRVLGMSVDHCMRLMSIALPGQILLTRFPFDDARRAFLKDQPQGLGELCWISHGLSILKEIEDPVEICEVGEMGIAPLRAPLKRPAIPWNSRTFPQHR
jgi:class 3 adenylate cyclase